MSARRPAASHGRNRRSTAIRRQEADKEGKILGARTRHLRLPLYEVGEVTETDIDTIYANLVQLRPNVLLLAPIIRVLINILLIVN